MIELSAFVIAFSIFFGIVGALRGWNRELGTLAGLIFVIFLLFQLDTLLRNSLYSFLTSSQVFIVQAGLFIGLVFVIYRSFSFSIGSSGTRWQASIIGFFIGMLNGYLISTTLWYFLDINQYPFEPYIIAPTPGSTSANMVNYLPIVVFGGSLTSGSDLIVIAIVAILILIIATR